MKTILIEFRNSMSNILNNFYLSFLAINFLKKQCPFRENVELAADMTYRIMDAQSLNRFAAPQGVQEYGASIRRHFLNDMVIAYERYSTMMIISHNNKQRRIDPCLIKKKLSAPLFERIKNVYQSDDLKFLSQLRRLRNSVVHYNGAYAATQKLNYTFGTQTFNSKGKEGQAITVTFDTLKWIYDKLIQIVQYGNSNYFRHYPIP